MISKYWESEEHIRPVWKLYWNAGAGACLTFQNERFDLEPGCLYLISPMTCYTPCCKEEVEHFYIHFKLPSEYRMFPQGIWKINPGRFSYSVLKEAWQEGIEHFRNSLLIQEIIACSLRQLDPSLFEQSQPNPLASVFDWLEDNLQGNCCNSRMAQIAGFSEDTLNRLFLKETGKTPQRYVLSLRISRAANYLRQSGLSVDEIAELCGFCDRAYFDKRFLGHAGLTPAAFRKAYNRL